MLVLVAGVKTMEMWCRWRENKINVALEVEENN